MPRQTPPVKSGDRGSRRAERRAEMVQAAVDAIRRHGAAVSVAEIAAASGVTKPVLYRHFTDRADLQRAVGEKAAGLLMERIAAELARDSEPRELIARVIDAFLAVIEEEPELWRFVVHNPLERTPAEEIVEDVREQIARTLATLIGERLRARSLDSGGAEAWAHGLVGMVQSAGDWWLERRTMSRAALTGYLTTLIWNGAAGILGPAADHAAPPPVPDGTEGESASPGRAEERHD